MFQVKQVGKTSLAEQGTLLEAGQKKEKYGLWKRNQASQRDLQAAIHILQRENKISRNST